MWLFALNFTFPTMTYAQLCAGDTGIDTAIGCIPVFTTPEGTAAFFIKWGLGVGGGIAFLLILFGGFQIMSSQGVPDKVKAGKELITASISGLLLLIFSVFLLEFIGYNILGLPI